MNDLKSNVMSGKGCHEFITNPGYYGKVNGNWKYEAPPPGASYDEKLNLTSFVCPKGEYLAGVLVFNAGEIIDRIFCCKL
jgi:hypothetical protein